MKRIFNTVAIFAMSLVLMTACAGNSNAKSVKSSVKSLIDNYEKERGFESINIGPFALSFVKAGVNFMDDDDDIESQIIKKSINDIKALTVADYSDCKMSVRREFEKKLLSLMARKELLIDAKDDGERVLIYGNVSEDGNIVKDVIIFVPDDCELVCLWGELGVEGLMSFAQQQ